MRNMLDGINSRLETTEKRLVNLKDRKENLKMNGAAVSYDKKFKVYHICVKKPPKEKEGDKKIIWCNNGNNNYYFKNK